ncbi:unnamed protein product [Arabis nemorensis]|uniref:Uncharacterized protein n=1 Tax=Arabis nemorensis TaxID=586526 RepID=A0A565CFL3_9BRAS|nr:unnamed protein product [Arabis nemorensis]
MLAYNTVFLIFLIALIVAIDLQNVVLAVFLLVVIFVLFLVVHVYMTALWHLASVVSVLEPVYGFAAMKKSYELLKGKTFMACSMVFIYLAHCGFIGVVFSAVVVRGGDDYGIFIRKVVGGFLEIDKSALNDHLGGYLGDYVPLKSNVQMENFEV